MRDVLSIRFFVVLAGLLALSLCLGTCKKAEAGGGLSCGGIALGAAPAVQVQTSAPAIQTFGLRSNSPVILRQSFPVAIHQVPVIQQQVIHQAVPLVAPVVVQQKVIQQRGVQVFGRSARRGLFGRVIVR